ncbi:MAG: hypothetical protein HY292_04505 [Planctomycetes bacterium]|nr:hypothetical protein [Planctomycetota bacterium]
MAHRICLSKPRPFTTIAILLLGTILFLPLASSLLWIALFVDRYPQEMRLLKLALGISGALGMSLIVRAVADFRQFCVVTVTDDDKWILTTRGGFRCAQMEDPSQLKVKTRPVRNLTGQTRDGFMRIAILSGRKVFRSVPARAETVESAFRNLTGAASTPRAKVDASSTKR